jgi:hypothetical protein
MLDGYDKVKNREDRYIGRLKEYDHPDYTIAAGATQAEFAGKNLINEFYQNALKLFQNTTYQPLEASIIDKQEFNEAIESIRSMLNNPTLFNMQFAIANIPSYLSRHALTAWQKQNDPILQELNRTILKQQDQAPQRKTPSPHPLQPYLVHYHNKRGVPLTYLPYFFGNTLLLYMAADAGLNPTNYNSQTLQNIGTEIARILEWGRKNILEPIKQEIRREAKLVGSRRGSQQLTPYEAYIISTYRFHQMVEKRIQELIQGQNPEQQRETLRKAMWFIGLTQINTLPTSQSDSYHTIMSFNLLYDSTVAAENIIRSALRNPPNGLPSVVRAAMGLHKGLSILSNAGQNYVFTSLLRPFIAYYESRRWSNNKKQQRDYYTTLDKIQRDPKETTEFWKMFARQPGLIPGTAGQTSYLYIVDSRLLGEPVQASPLQYAFLYDKIKEHGLSTSTEQLMGAAYEVRKLLETKKLKLPKKEEELLRERLDRLLEGKITIKEIGQLETQIDKIIGMSVPSESAKTQQQILRNIGGSGPIIEPNRIQLPTETINRLKNLRNLLETQEYILDSLHAVAPDVLPRTTLQLMLMGTGLSKYVSEGGAKSFLYGIPAFVSTEWLHIGREALGTGFAAAKARYERTQRDQKGIKGFLPRFMEAARSGMEAALVPLTQGASEAGDTGDIIITAIPRASTAWFYENIMGGHPAGMSFYTHSSLYGLNFTERFLGRWRETGRITGMGEGIGEFMGIMVLSMADPLQWGIEAATLLLNPVGGAVAKAATTARVAERASRIAAAARGARWATHALTALSKPKAAIATLGHVVAPYMEKVRTGLRFGYRAGRDLLNIGYITARGWGDFGDFFDAYVMSDGDWSTVLFAMFSDFEYMTRHRNAMEKIRQQGLKPKLDLLAEMPGLAPFFGTFEPYRRALNTIYQDAQQYHATMNSPYGLYLRGILKLREQTLDLLGNNTTPYQNQTVWFRIGQSNIWQPGTFQGVVGSNVQIKDAQGTIHYVNPQNIIVNLPEEIKNNPIAWKNIPTAYLYHALRIINKGGVTFEMINQLYGDQISAKVQQVLIRNGLATINNNGEYTLTARGGTLLQTIDNPSDRTVQYILEKMFLMRTGNEAEAERNARTIIEKIKTLPSELGQQLKRTIVAQYLHIVSRSIQNIIENLPLEVYIGKSDGFKELVWGQRHILTTPDGTHSYQAYVRGNNPIGLEDRIIVKVPNNGALPNIFMLKEFVESTFAPLSEDEIILEAIPVGVRESGPDATQPYWEIALDLVVRSIWQSDQTLIGTGVPSPKQETIQAIQLVLSKLNNDINNVRAQFEASQAEEPYGYGLMHALSELLMEQRAEQLTPTATLISATKSAQTILDGFQQLLALKERELAQEQIRARADIERLEKERKQLLEEIGRLQRELNKAKHRNQEEQQRQTQQEIKRLEQERERIRLEIQGLEEKTRIREERFREKVRSVFANLATYGVIDPPNTLPVPPIDGGSPLRYIFDRALIYSSEDPFAIVSGSILPTIGKYWKDLVVSGLTSLSINLLGIPLVLPRPRIVARSIYERWRDATIEEKANRIAKEVARVLSNAPEDISTEINEIAKRVASQTLPLPIAVRNELLHRMANPETVRKINIAMTTPINHIFDELPDNKRPQTPISLDDVFNTIMSVIDAHNINPNTRDIIQAQFAATLAMTEHVKEIIAQETGMTPQEQAVLQRAVDTARLMALISIVNTTPQEIREQIKDELKKLGVPPELIDRSERFLQEQYSGMVFRELGSVLTNPQEIHSHVRNILEFYRDALWLGIDNALNRFRNTNTYRTIAWIIRDHASTATEDHISLFRSGDANYLLQTGMDRAERFFRAVAETVMGLDYFHKRPNQRSAENANIIKETIKKIGELGPVLTASTTSIHSPRAVAITYSALKVPFLIRGATERALTPNQLGQMLDPFQMFPRMFVSPGSALTTASLTEETLHTLVESIIRLTKRGANEILLQRISPDITTTPSTSFVQDLAQHPSFTTLLKSLGVLEKWLNETDNLKKQMDRQLAHLTYTISLGPFALNDEEIIVDYLLMTRLYESLNNPSRAAVATFALTLSQVPMSEISQTMIVNPMGLWLLLIPQRAKGMLRTTLQHRFEELLKTRIQNIYNRGIADELLSRLGL